MAPHRIVGTVDMMRTTKGYMATAALFALSGCMVPPPEPLDRPPDYDAGEAAGPTTAPPPPVYRPAPAWQSPSSVGAESAADYYWIDQADEFARVIGTAPPDFAFSFDGVEAWSWISGTGEAMLVEPARSGVVQYYFEPRAASPYLVRDSYFSYAFEGPNLVAIYDHRGALIEPGDSRARPEEGERLLERGRAIMAASLRRRWDRGTADRWSGQSWFVPEILLGWSGDWRRRGDWQDYRRRHDDDRDREVRRHREEERRMRREAAGRWDNWRREGRRGPIPDGVLRPGRLDDSGLVPDAGRGTARPDRPGATPDRPGRGPGPGPGTETSNGSGRPRGPNPPPPVADPPPPPPTPPQTDNPAPPAADPDLAPRRPVGPRRRPTAGEPDPVVPAIARDPDVIAAPDPAPAETGPTAGRRQGPQRIDAGEAEAIAAQRRAEAERQAADQQAAEQQAARQQAAAQQAELEAGTARRLEMEQVAREQRAQALAERAAEAEAARQAERETASRQQAEAERQAEAEAQQQRAAQARAEAAAAQAAAEAARAAAAQTAAQPDESAEPRRRIEENERPD